MLDFPASPSVDDLYPDPVVSGVPQWRWDGARWIDVVSGAIGGGASVTVDVDPPDDPETGDLWFDSVGLVLYLWYVDDGGGQWVPANPGGGGGAGASIAVSPTAPDAPQDGDLWWDSSNGLMFVRFDGQWIAVSGAGGGGGGAKVTTSAIAPSGAEEGDLWWDSVSGVMYIHFGSAWVAVSGGAAGAPGTPGGVTAAAVAPDAPAQGDLWWDSSEGVLYIRFNEQWIGASAAGPQGPEGPPGAPGAEGPEGPAAVELDDAPDDGKLYGRRNFDWEEIEAGGGGGGGGGAGVTDGSAAAAGDIGEVLEFAVAGGALNGNMASDAINTDFTLVLPAGDWQVSGQIHFQAISGTIQWADVKLGPSFGLIWAGQFHNGGQQLTVPINAVPVRLAAQTSYQIHLTATTSAGGNWGTANYSGCRSRLYARRMR